jgi:hypothetical protein
MKKKHRREMIDREAVENAMIDSVRLRAALLLACTELTGGDPLEGWGLCEQFYDAAPALLDSLSGDLSRLPCGPAKILNFPTKTTNET